MKKYKAETKTDYNGNDYVVFEGNYHDDGTFKKNRNKLNHLKPKKKKRK